MARSAAFLALLALPLCSALIPTADPAGLNAAWKICEAQTAADCDAARCAACTRLDGTQLCFTPETAAKLPSFAFRCVMPDAQNGGQVGGEAKPTPAPWQVCEALKADECSDADDRCSLCTRMDGTELCFSPEVAAKLPKFAFKCTKPRPAGLHAPSAGDDPDAPKPKPKPWAICEKLNATECAAASDRCDLCQIMGGKSMCFDPSIASKLPPGIFKCTGPGPEPETEPTLSAAAAEQPSAKPSKVICEMLDAAECKDAEKECSLCTSQWGKGKQLCFRPDVAAGLSPWAFKCTGAQPTPQPMQAVAPSAGRRAGPTDKVDPQQEAACEGLALSQCSVQAGCTPCTRIDGWELCFSSELAAKLSPYAFQCAKPAPLATADVAADADVDKPKPKPAPWVPCESFHGKACTDAPGCVLCTPASGAPMCFHADIAAKFPPAVFKCTKPKEDEAPSAVVTSDSQLASASSSSSASASSSSAPEPAPWVPCEAYPPAECDAAHCSLCTVIKKGKQLCFNPTVAAKLPPAFFSCTNPETAKA